MRITPVVLIVGFILYTVTLFTYDPIYLEQLNTMAIILVAMAIGVKQ